MDSRFTVVRIWFACGVAGTRLKAYRWMQRPILLLSKHDRTTVLQVPILASSLRVETTMLDKGLMDKAAGDREFLRHRGVREVRVPPNWRPLSHLQAIRL